eukprot:3578681-Lingulodinium_polyedra.AAC.1
MARQVGPPRARRHAHPRGGHPRLARSGRISTQAVGSAGSPRSRLRSQEPRKRGTIGGMEEGPPE